MQRKEVCGTSGSRMTLCFFGGFDGTAAEAESRYLAETGFQ